MTFTKASN